MFAKTYLSMDDRLGRNRSVAQTAAIVDKRIGEDRAFSFVKKSFSRYRG